MVGRLDEAARPGANLPKSALEGPNGGECMKFRTVVACVAALLTIAGTASADSNATKSPGAVTAKRLAAASSEPGQWLSVGRTL